MRDDRLGYDVPDEEYDNMSEGQRQVIDENTIRDTRYMMGLDELEDEESLRWRGFASPPNRKWNHMCNYYRTRSEKTSRTSC